MLPICGLLLVSLVGWALPNISHAAFQESEEAASKIQKPNSVSGEILVRFRSNAIPASSTPKLGMQAAISVEESGSQLAVRIERLNSGPEIVSGLRIARVAPEETERAIDALRKRSDVIYAEPNYIRHKEAMPNDIRYGAQWALKNTGQSGGLVGADIDGEQAWNTTTGSRDVVVAVIDEGIDVNHEDLRANIWHNPGEIQGNGIDDDGDGYVDDVFGYDFFHNDATVYDGPGTNPDGSTIDAHGTHVAGTIGATGNNGLGVVGVNWQVSLMPLKILGPDGGTTADLLRALAYAKMMRDLWVSSGGVKGANVRVTNNSYGGDNYSQAEFDAIQATGNSGILFVAAAGNEGQDNQIVPGYPASYDLPTVISVAATDRNDNLAGFSNRGSRSVQLGAPGVSILSTTPGNNYSFLSGTSMASPHVAGAAALVLAAHPQFSVERLRSAIIFGGNPLSSLSQTTITGNRLNAAGALQNAAEIDTIVPATITNLQVGSQDGRNVSLEWTAPGDDGNSGRASLYEIRFVDQTTGAKYFVGAQRPVAAGLPELADVNIPYRHVAGTLTLIVYDNVGNSSLASITITVNPNAAEPYIVAQGPSTTLSTGGSALNANFDDALINYSLPFNFPVFERFASGILVSTNGAIYFRPSSPADYDLLNAADRLSSFHMIAGLWDDLDLRTSARADAGIYVVQPNSDRIIFRWQGVPCNPNLAIGQCTGGAPVNFEIELNRDGTIVTRYGDGNTGLHPVVGLGGGEPDAYPIASHTSELAPKDLTNAATVTFQLRNPPKRADLKLEIKSYPNPVMVGGNSNYTVTVTNDGPDSASSVRVVDTLSIVAQFVSCSSSVGSCSGPNPGKSGQVFANLGRLASGTSATLTIVAAAPILQSSYSNNAVVSSLTYDPNLFFNTSSLDTVVYRPNPNPLTQVMTMAAGGGHYLALKVDGSVLAWGDNHSGQLGDGTFDAPMFNAPKWVKGLASVKSVAAGYDHSLAIKPNGTLWAWGANYMGQLGDGSTNNRRSLPARVNGIADVKEAAGGLGHTIAVKNDGTVWTWGDNSSGQIGDDTNINRLTPVQVPGISGVTAVAAGFNYSAALRADGTVWEWGNNFQGQLGDGTNTSKRIPIQVVGLTAVVAIAADGNFTMALRSDGTVWSWGANIFGQLGDGTTTNRTAPVQVSGLSGVTAITSGGAHGLALRSDGTIWAWGDNGNGRLGIGLGYSTQSPQTRPLPIIILTNAVAIAAGGSTSLALAPDGTLFSWGAGNNFGYPYQATAGEPRQSLSLPSFSPDGGSYSSPQSVTVSYPSTTATISAFSTGGEHTAAVMSDGKVYSWGRNNRGQLGAGPGQGSSSTIPLAAIGLTAVSSVSGGFDYTIALKTDGTVWGWGNNDFGQLGDGTGSTTPSPVQATGLTNVMAISAGVQHTLALRSDGTVWAWGNNVYGGLGDGSQTNRHSPVQVNGLTGVKAIAAGVDHSLAVKTDGTVWAWGRNIAGELGDGTNSAFRTNPVQVTGLTNVTAVAGAVSCSMALRNDGTIWMWGSNQYGQLGDGTNSSRRTAAIVPNLTSVVAISAGGETTMARRNDGTVWTWGQNFRRQLGTGSNDAWSYLPVQVTGATNSTAIDMGGSHAASLASDGTLSLWGLNESGQLGDGTTLDRNVPTKMTFFSGNPVIHYTTNGAEPTDDDPVVSSGSSILIDQNTVLKAKAFREGFAPSSVKSGLYVINAAPTWEGVVLTTGQAEIKTWLYQSRTYAYLKLSFPNAGYRVTNWGQATRVGNDFTADAAVEKFAGASVQAVTTTAQIYDLGPLANGTYNFNFRTSGTLAKTLQFTISSTVPPPNTIDDARQFVKQQYRDFLNREADQAGEDFWTDNITKCNDPARRPPDQTMQTVEQCTVRQRETTSGAFFLSPEFQYTGYFVYRMYQGGLGRQPKLSEFIPDAQFVGNGIIVGGQLSGAKINQNKAAFATLFVNCTDATKYRCAEFKAIYDALNNQQYVDKLFLTTGVNASASDRTALVDGLNGGTETRATVLQKVVDGINVISEGNQQFTTTYGQAFYNSEFNRAFVELEYFGYMKRDPDDAGYAFWLGKLNQFGGNFVNAEMVLAFISSPEYRARFGQP